MVAQRVRLIKEESISLPNAITVIIYVIEINQSLLMAFTIFTSLWDTWTNNLQSLLGLGGGNVPLTMHWKREGCVVIKFLTCNFCVKQHVIYVLLFSWLRA